LEAAKAAVEESKPKKESKRGKAPRRSREELYANLPVLEEKVIEPQEVLEAPEDYKRIGEEETFEVDVDPPKFYRRRIIRPKYLKKNDKQSAPLIAAAAPRPVEGIASVGLLAQIAVSKYSDHLPLYRQAVIYKRHGFATSRQNLVRWVEQIADWLKPLYNHMRKKLLAGDYLQIDETPIKYCDPDYDQKKTRKGQLCAYSRPDSEVCYLWSLSRSEEKITSHLEDFKGVLQSDAYAPYLAFERKHEAVQMAACWAHARRKFFEAKELNPRECGLYLKLVSRLYRVESEIREKKLENEEALALRRAKATNTHKRIHRLLKILAHRALPKSRLGKAASYSLRIWPQLSTYLQHGRVQIDNNLLENAMRPVALGKKNWMFIGHPQAGERGAVIYSILESCRRFEIEPLSYLKKLLSTDLSSLPEKEMSDLTPSKWRG
jgi:transposase